MRVDVGQALRVFTKYNADFSQHYMLDSTKAKVDDKSGPAIGDANDSSVSAVIETHYSQRIDNFGVCMQKVQNFVAKVQEIDSSGR